eukprot:22941_1
MGNLPGPFVVNTTQLVVNTTEKFQSNKAPIKANAFVVNTTEKFQSNKAPIKGNAFVVNTTEKFQSNKAPIKANAFVANTTQSNKAPVYDMDIINQLIQFDMGTESEIMNAMDAVNDRNDVNQIIEYLKNVDKTF